MLYVKQGGPIRKQIVGVICMILIMSINSAQATTMQDGWKSLFNGKNLKGWEQQNGTATYEVVDGTIVGTTVEGSPNSFLATKKSYGDFELEFQVKVDDQLNSGIMFRAKTRESTIGEGRNQQKGRVIGPQVEIEASGPAGAESGYLYSEGTGKGWLTPEDKLKPHKLFKDGEWNHYRIVAKGSRVQTWINGEMVEDLTNDEDYQEFPTGFIGLQVHGIKAGTGPYQVAWKDIRIKEY